MKKTGMTAAIAMMMAVAAPAAFAQTADKEPARPMTAAPAALSIQPDQMRASKLIGSTVYDVQNQNIGSVKDIIVDREGKVDAVVVDVGSFLGMGGKYVAVSLNDIKNDHDRLTMNRTKDQLKSAQAYQLEPATKSTYGSSDNRPTNNKAGQ